MSAGRCVTGSRAWVLFAALLASGCGGPLLADRDVLVAGGDTQPFFTTVRYGDSPVEPVTGDRHAASWGAVVTLPVSPAAGTDGGRYLLDTGDRLRVFVYGQPNLSRLYNVDHEGKIAVPLIGNVRVRGMTTYGVEATIRSLLGARFVRDPQVTVDVQQNRPFFILGEVRNAGQYPFVSGMTVETAVAIAGGYSERANERKARVTRRGDGTAEVFEAPPDFILQPGDSIYVYERFL